MKKKIGSVPKKKNCQLRRGGGGSRLSWHCQLRWNRLENDVASYIYTIFRKKYQKKMGILSTFVLRTVRTLAGMSARLTLNLKTTWPLGGHLVLKIGSPLVGMPTKPITPF